MLFNKNMITTKLTPCSLCEMLLCNIMSRDLSIQGQPGYPTYLDKDNQLEVQGPAACQNGKENAHI